MAGRVCQVRGCDIVLPKGRTNPRCRACQYAAEQRTKSKDPAKYLAKKRADARRVRERHGPRILATLREKRRLLREEFLREYGGICSCCGEYNEKFLTLEHLNADGSEHRKSVGTYTDTLLRDLKKRGWPKDAYALHCFNCNLGKARNGGVCPHKEDKVA